MTIDFSGATPPNASASADPANAQQGAANVAPNANSQDEGVVLEWNGRKFTKEDLVKKLENADGFIETLKQERQQDRALLNEVQETLKKQLTAQELLAQVKATATAEAAPAAKPEAGVDANAIAAQVLAKLQGDQARQQEEQNWTGVVAKLNQAFGDKVNEKVKAVAQENGLTVEEAANLARTKPQLFLKLFPEVNKQPTVNPLSGLRSNGPVLTQQPTSGKLFMDNRTTRDSVSHYLSRLKELSGG